MCFIEGVHGTQIVNYGVSTYSQKNQIIFQRYYQWMVMVLIAQAVICYLPAYLWKTFEKGLLKDLCDGIGELNWSANCHKSISIDHDCLFPYVDSMIARDKWSEQKRRLIAYFNGRYAGAVNTRYAYSYAVCKFISLISIVSNLFACPSYKLLLTTLTHVYSE